MAITAKMVASEVLICGVKAGLRRFPGVGEAIEVVENLQRRHESLNNSARLAELEAQMSRTEKAMRGTVQREIQTILTNLGRPAVPGPELTREMNELRQIYEQGWMPNLFEGLLRNSTHWEEFRRNPKTFGRILGDHEPLDPDSMHLLIDKDTTRILELPTASLALLLSNQSVGVPQAEMRAGQDIWAFPTSKVSHARTSSSFVNSIGMTMRRIPAGSFSMGSTEERDEEPRHLVTISKPFYLGVYPVTQDEFSTLMHANPSQNLGDGRLPVDSTTWFDAIDFCNALSEAEGWTPFYRVKKDSVEVIDWNGSGYRLPTEAEWEYACRAGSPARFSFGEDERSLGDYAWYVKNSNIKTHPVGGRKANAWDLFDMQGNVWEWCWDWYDKSYYSESSEIDPHGPPGGERRIQRGGSRSNEAEWCRPATRGNFWPMFRNDDPGFRVAAFRSDK